MWFLNCFVFLAVPLSQTNLCVVNIIRTLKYKSDYLASNPSVAPRMCPAIGDYQSCEPCHPGWNVKPDAKYRRFQASLHLLKQAAFARTILALRFLPLHFPFCEVFMALLAFYIVFRWPYLGLCVPFPYISVNFTKMCTAALNL